MGWVRTRWIVLGLLCAAPLAACSDGSTESASTSTTEASQRTRELGDVSCPTDEERFPVAEYGDASIASKRPDFWAWSVVCESYQESSLAVHDFDGDGVADVVINPLDSEGVPRLVVLSGVNGDVVWSSGRATMQITVPAIGDLNGDGVADVVAGGRQSGAGEPTLLAFDGRDGSELWQPDSSVPWQNVFAPELLADVDGDGGVDVLVVSGGENSRDADEAPTVPGRLVILNGSNGRKIAELEMPDGQESYQSPVTVKGADGQVHIVIGTGGEVFSGSLWRITLADLLGQEPSGFVKLLDGGTSSYIAPVAEATLPTGETVVIATRLDGLVSVVDPLAAASTPLWERSFDELAAVDTSTQVLVGLAAPAVSAADSDGAVTVATMLKTLDRAALHDGALIAGDATYVAFDLLTGDVRSALTVAKHSSVASPLLATVDGRLVSLCTCVEAQDSTGWGMWDVASGEVKAVGLGAPVASTAALAGPSSATATVPSAEPTEIDGYVVGNIDGFQVVVRFEVGTGTVSWGSYLQGRVEPSSSS